MKFKFTDEHGNDYEIEIKAKDNRQLNASRKALQTVLTEIANVFGCAASYWRNVQCKHLEQYASDNAQHIIDALLSNLNQKKG